MNCTDTYYILSFFLILYVDHAHLHNYIKTAQEINFNTVNNKSQVNGNRLVGGIGSTYNYSLTAKYVY